MLLVRSDQPVLKVRTIATIQSTKTGCLCVWPNAYEAHIFPGDVVTYEDFQQSCIRQFGNDFRRICIKEPTKSCVKLIEFLLFLLPTSVLTSQLITCIYLPTRFSTCPTVQLLTCYISCYAQVARVSKSTGLGQQRGASSSRLGLIFPCLTALPGTWIGAYAPTMERPRLKEMCCMKKKSQPCAFYP